MCLMQEIVRHMLIYPNRLFQDEVCLKPALITALTSSDIYCRAYAHIFSQQLPQGTYSVLYVRLFFFSLRYHTIQSTVVAFLAVL